MFSLWTPCSIVLEIEANPALRGIPFVGRHMVKVSAYADGITIFVSRLSDIEAVKMAVARYEQIAGAKIYFDKSIGLRWGGVPLPGPFHWSDCLWYQEDDFRSIGERKTWFLDNAANMAGVLLEIIYGVTFTCPVIGWKTTNHGALSAHLLYPHMCACSSN